MIYGYVRISTKGQRDGNSIEDQSKLIKERYLDANIIIEVYSGAKERPIFNEMINGMEKGDTLVVTKLDRFCRTTKEGLSHIDELMTRGIRIHILNMGLVEDTAMGRMIITNLLAFAEFERAMILERTQAGKAIARERIGYSEGRPTKRPDDVEQVIRDVEKGIKTVADAIKELGISRKTWYNWKKAVEI